MSSSSICSVCTRQYAQYTCPRCNTQYCSVPCYKDHGGKCTQEFYSQNVRGDLQGVQSQKEDKKAIERAIKDIYARNWDELSPSEGDDSDGSESGWIDDLTEEQVQKVVNACNSDQSIDLEAILPASVVEDFKKQAHRGGLNHLVTPWQPWWKLPAAASLKLSTTGTALVQARRSTSISGSSPIQSSSTVSEIPALLKDPLPPVQDLLKGEVSPSLRWHLVDLVYCYCFIVRQYNGDVRTDVVECSERALDLSVCLTSSQPPPESRKEGITDILQNASSKSVHGDRRFAISTLKDVQRFCEIGSAPLLLALNDLKTWLESARSEILDSSPQRKNNERRIPVKKSTVAKAQEEMKALQIQKNVALSLKREDDSRKSDDGLKDRKKAVRKLQFAVRKIWFIMAWANEQDRDWYQCLGNEIQLSLEELAASFGGRKSQQKDGNIVTRVG